MYVATLLTMVTPLSRSWRSVEGSTVANAGMVRFQPNEQGGTRVGLFGGQNGLYHNFGWWAAFGGQLMDEEGTCTADETGVDQAYQFLVELQNAGATFYPNYDDIARFEYGRRLWRLPEMRRRLLAIKKTATEELQALELVKQVDEARRSLQDLKRRIRLQGEDAETLAEIRRLIGDQG
jgi:hypothetical protein